MADGTSFEIDIDVQSKGAEPAAAQMAKLADRLQGAQTASLAAAEAVKAGEAAYRQAEASASKAAAAVEKVAVQYDGLRQKQAAAMAAGDEKKFWQIAGALGALEQRQAEAKKTADAMAVSVQREGAALDGLRSAAARASSTEEQLTKSHKQAEAAAVAEGKAAAAAAGSGKVNEMAEAFGKLGGPLGAVGQKAFGAVDGFKKLGSSLGALGPYAAAAIAIAAVVAGIIALGIATIKATVDVAIWAVGLGDIARSSRLATEAIAGTTEGGAALGKTIGDLESRVPIARDELLGMAKQLAATGLKGKDLSAALEDAAEKAAIVKFGPNFASEMLSLDRQSQRLGANVKKIFSGLKIDALEKALSVVFSLFDEGSASANAIKVVFESIFQPLIDGATAFLPKVRTAFIQFEIWAMKAAIAIKPWVSTLGYLAAGLAIVGAAILVGILIPIGLVLVPIAALIALVSAVVAGVVWLGVQLYNLGAAILDGAVHPIDFLVAKWTEAKAWLASLDLSEIGAQIVAGLARGIFGASPEVMTSIKGVANDALNSAKSFLGISSPSKLFEAQVGENVGLGIAGGIEGTAGDVGSAIESATSPDNAAAPGGGAAGASGGGSGNTYIFQIGGGGGDDEGLIAKIRELLVLIVEGNVAKLGGGTPA